MRRLLLLIVPVAAAILAQGAAASGPGPLAAGASSRIEISFAPTAGLPEGITQSMFDAFKFRGEMDYTAHRGRLSFGSAESAVIYDGNTIYTKSVLQQLVPDAKPWVRFDSASNLGDPFNVEEQAVALGPGQLLPWLRGGSTELRAAGSEIVSGTSTTRYEATLDFEKVVESAPAADQQELRLVLEMFKEDPQISTRIPYTVWVDRRGLTHRLRFVDGPVPFGMAVTIEFSDFDVPIVLDLPPAADVMGPEEFIQAMLAYEKAHPSQGCGNDGTPTVTETTTEEGDGGSVTICLRSLGGK